MKLLKNIRKSVLAPVFVGVAVVWLLGYLNEFVPSPGRTWLAVTNLAPAKHERPEDRFRVVLCWLENDRDGSDTRIVAHAFSSIAGISLVRSAWIVEASGAADDWRRAMQGTARDVLKQWNADLAVVGVVKQPREVLSLWFVPGTDGGTLERGDQPYVLEDATLGKDFHDDLQRQLAALALTAVAPLATSKLRRGVLKKELRIATEKLTKLTQNSVGRRVEYQAAMEAGLADALVALGRTETGTELFKRAIARYRAALKVFTRGRNPELWSLTMNSLGVALVAIAERETGTERLVEAVSAYQAALEERSREREPLDWAVTQNNLGVALATIGEREGNAELLEEAIAAYKAALEERTRTRYPSDWAMTQNNLANALVRRFRLQGGGREELEEGIRRYHAALEERTREHVSLQWAETQGNLGGALVDRGKRDSSSVDFHEAVDIFRAVLTEFGRDDLPLQWAGAQIGLGAALRALAKQEDNPTYLGEAVRAYQAALQVLSPTQTPLVWAMAQNNLGNALRDLATYENSTKHLKDAREAYRSALNVLNAGDGSSKFRDKVQMLLDHTVRVLNSRHAQ